MDDAKPNMVAELLGALWAVWVEMFDVLVAVAPKVFKFILWVLCGLIILPCVFIAGNFFNKWQEWGETF